MKHLSLTFEENYAFIEEETTQTKLLQLKKN